MLVTLWTAFSEAFASIMSTLFIPLSLAALGIVLRGAGFAFQRSRRAARARRFAEWAFAISSVLTPFFMGTVVGAVASGRVPVGNAAGDAVTSWLNPLSLVLGALFVATGAYLAAVFLVSDARRFGDARPDRYFSARARAAAVVAGALAVGGIFALRADARFVYDGLTSEGLPLVIASLVCGLGALVLLWRGARRGVRPLAVAAVVAVIWGWGVAQYPYLLPQTLTISTGAARERDADRRARGLRRGGGPRAARARVPLHARPAQPARGGSGALSRGELAQPLAPLVRERRPVGEQQVPEVELVRQPRQALADAALARRRGRRSRRRA